MSQLKEIDYFLYDSRYYNNPERAIVLTFSDTLEEAEKDKKEMFPNAAIVKVTSIDNIITKKELIK